MPTELILPQLGETMDEGTISAWHKQVGDWVEKGDALCSVETDKAVLDVESPSSGYLAKILTPAGTVVPVLQAIAYLSDQKGEATGEGAPAARESTASAAAVGSEPSASGGAVAVAEPPADEEHPLIRISPVARKLARQHGIEFGRLKGTGPKGRIVEADVRTYLQLQESAAAQAPVAPVRELVAVAERKVETAAPPVAPPVAPSLAPQPSAGEWDLVPFTRMRRIIADKLSQSYREAVHVTLNCEVDMAEAAKLRTQLIQEWEPKHGLKVTYTDLIVKAVAKALTEHRALNASYAQDGIRQHKHVNVGVAVSVGSGLVVPVVRDVDTLQLLDVARSVRRLTERARAMQFTPDELQGGTFTVTNMGMLGVDTFTPIINGAEGAILGVGRLAERPVVRDGAVVARPTMPMSLSFDHRIVDGAGAAAFLARVKQILEGPYLLFV